jgi:hypothetical protein
MDQISAHTDVDFFVHYFTTSQFKSDLCVTIDSGAAGCASSETVGPPIHTLLIISTNFRFSSILSSNQHDLDENLIFSPISLFSAE